ncbi:MAG TPA: CRISPR-associated ring nuclease [Ktedonosporobacter sp.]|nr:CRISPR-associated ring nuclease [Ktedonosporobacter sp.]
MTEAQPKALKLFCSFAQEDDKLLTELEKYLHPLERQQQITIWHRNKIAEGRNFLREIKDHLNTAQIILLLVSPDFLASDHCYSVEMQRAIERQRATNTVRVIPIILRHSDWQDTPFGGLKALPDNHIPITESRNRDKAFLNVVQGIRRTIEELNTLLPLPQEIESLERNEPLLPSLLPQQEQSNLPEIQPEESDFLAPDKTDRASQLPITSQVFSPLISTRNEASKNVLIASLGESPVVVSAMYDLLTKRKKLKIDRVIILTPEDDDVRRAYKMVREALVGVEVQCEQLPFKDADSWVHVCIFLQSLYKLLDTSQAKGEGIYLSCAGGRKSMAALMAWVAPFFSCVQNLYYLIDKDKKDFPLVEQIDPWLSPAKLERIMHPDLAHLTLVDIPFEKERQMSQKRLNRLIWASSEDLERMQYEEKETAMLLQAVTQGGKLLDVLVTKQVAEQFRVMCQQNPKDAIELKSNLEQMSIASKLQNASFDSCKPPKLSVTLHFFQRFQTPQRFVFYTKPEDIDEGSEEAVAQVVVCALEEGVNNEYRKLKKIAASPDFSVEPKYRLDELPLIPYTDPAESVLIVPLGTLPMIATQLYTLLEYQERRTIRAVYLVYPERAMEIENAARIVKRALQERAGVSCISVQVPGLEDIDSKEACKRYQAILEEVIAEVRERYPDCKIDLALSGGRKGMTAMTISAAQGQHIHPVYHTLITDEQLGRDIDRETTVEALNDLSRKERNDRLFLQSYKDGGSYARFVLFKVPVFSIEQEY